MKKVTTTLLLATLLSACSKEPTQQTPLVEGASTYVGFAIKYDNALLAGGHPVTRSADDDYNSIGTYEGRDLISTIDLYLSSPDGTFLQSQRFEAETDLTYTYDAAGLQLIKAKSPIKTTPGNKIATVIINSARPLMATQPDDDQTITVSTSLPFTSIGAFVDNDGERILKTSFSGKSAETAIAEGVTVEGVQAGANIITLDVTRLISRVIVTKTADMESTTTLDGTFSDISYAIGQCALTTYVFPQTDDTEYKSWGYDFVPDGNYLAEATKYYHYDDLLTPIAVPNNLNTTADNMANLVNYEGKLLLENTHLAGSDASSSKYKKGNTTYILVSTVFTPNPSMIKDGGALTDGTFYVGDTDGQLYSSIAAAQDVSTGSYNQQVRTYTGGKVLYYVWLNPDNVAHTMNSPVVRNNIYQINIAGIHKLGVNWNPLNPSVNNPDPKPEGNEPPSPIVPTDPLSLDDTYMSVDIEVKNWTVHSYDVTL
ncbi:MAG: Mfa1 family fimbria major subunit [Rikenellaceae bacterium]|jgi:hypothetical protein|nr:Mfa1 family fimbria major subunit [Rikenellaceae bacterium]